MSNFLKKFFILFVFLISKQGLTLSSSSYLIANTAIELYDFEVAYFEFSKSKIDLLESDHHNQLLTVVNLNLLDDANKVAKKLLKNNRFNQEAWIVLLSHSLINKQNNFFLDFQKIDKDIEMDLLKFIFFKKNGDIKNKKNIARSIFEVVQASTTNDQNQFSYKFLLFYLSIANLLDPDFNEALYFTAQIYQNLENYTKAEFYYSKINYKHNLYPESQKKYCY